MDDKHQADPDGKGDAARGDVNLKEQNRALKQGLMSEREKRHAVEREVSELKGRMDALSKQTTAPTKTYSRSELRALVDEGKLDEARADEIMDQQLTSKVTSTVTDSVVSALSSNQLKDRVEAEIGRYTALVPDVMETGSAARQRVEQEYQYLTSLGDAPDKATELKALRSVYGPVDKLTKSEPARETHQEHGDDSVDTGDDGMRTDGMPKGLTAAQRAYYKPMIGRQYKDWKAVEDELKYANPRITKRYANL